MSNKTLPNRAILLGSRRFNVHVAHAGITTDSPAACATRKQFLERYADKPVLVLGTHFANPVGGHIVRDGDTYRFAV